MTDEASVTPAPLDPAIVVRLKRDENGLIAAIAQQYDTGEVLMLAWMDDEALRRTLATGRVTYWSRSRREYWTKGATSGNTQVLKSAALDCDGDALLLKVDQSGAACHTGDRTCFDAGALPLGPAARAAAGPAEPSEPAEPAEPSGEARDTDGPLGESAP